MNEAKDKPVAPDPMDDVLRRMLQTPPQPKLKEKPEENKEEADE